MNKIVFFFLLSLILTLAGSAAIDSDGQWHRESDGQLVNAFGVNYNVPFAYTYRKIKEMGLDHKKIIDDDLYHFSRLGINAYRIHLWDIEISDRQGNLLSNDHLDCLDYLLARLKERDIDIVLTLVSMNGNGYPEADTAAPGFADIYNKINVVEKEAAIKALENYFPQLLNHVNKYTGIAYKNEPSLIALELNNEPAHSKDKRKNLSYIKRLIQAVKSTGCNKALFYNITQNPYLREIYYKAGLRGFSHCWYPTGLGQKSFNRNFIRQLEDYPMFWEKDRQYQKAAKMVYEFDCASTQSSYAYPLMARTFRQKGFQFAAMFCYDPMVLGRYNSEYPVHYMNLAYTPQKALSLKIAGEVFRQTALAKKTQSSQGNKHLYVDALENVSVFRDKSKFFYTNSNALKPRSPRHIRHIAGYGSSTLVQYNGKGAYFLDRVEAGIWRIEVMPDCMPLSNPFDYRGELKAVTAIYHNHRLMKLALPGLSGAVTLQGINRGNNFLAKNSHAVFSITPGTYLIYKNNISSSRIKNILANAKADFCQFVAPLADKQKLLNDEWSIKRKPSVKEVLPSTNCVLFNKHSKAVKRLSQGATKKLMEYPTTQTIRGERGLVIEIKPESLNWPPRQLEITMDINKPASHISEGGYLVVKAMSSKQNTCPLKIVLGTKTGNVYTASLILTNRLKEYRIPLKTFRQDDLLRYNCYPSFLPALIKQSLNNIIDFNPHNLIFCGFRLGFGMSEAQIKAGVGLLVESVKLENN
ncbi:MAG: hypothetical protein HRT88_15920 [Lentisphaeraceae bacterium]|nr:hypothetical protein [Lentisphaeraceae bacterium]